MKMHSLGSRCSFPKVVDIYIVNIFRIEELEKCSVETSVLESSNKSFHKVIFYIHVHLWYVDTTWKLCLLSSNFLTMTTKTTITTITTMITQTAIKI